MAASFGSIALCLHWPWLLRCHNNKKGDSKTADSQLSEPWSDRLSAVPCSAPAATLPMTTSKNHKIQQRKVRSFMTNINCIFPGTLRSWCNDNCPFITLWQKHAANTILRSNIWQKLTLFWPSKRIGEGSGYSMSVECQVFHQMFTRWPRRAPVRGIWNTRLHAPKLHLSRLTRENMYVNTAEKF